VLYLRLKQHLLTERAAIAAMNTFAGFHGVISPRRTRQDDGTAKSTFAVLIPAGRRPSSVVKQLRVQAPHTDWQLVDVDAERYESEVMPEATP
jgi:hypothetical protein